MTERELQRLRDLLRKLQDESVEGDRDLEAACLLITMETAVREKP